MCLINKCFDNDIFQRYAILRELIQDYNVYNKLSSFSSSENKNGEVEYLRERVFYNFILKWCAIFGNDKENLHWKKVISTRQDEFYKRYDLKKDEVNIAWKNALNWRNSVVAHIDVKKGDYPKKDDLSIHYKLLSSFYTECYFFLEKGELSKDCIVKIKTLEKESENFADNLLAWFRQN